MGGISEHFIWQVDLVEHFIWKVDLIMWLFQMGSHWRHRWGNSWSAVTGSFMGGTSDTWSGHFTWKHELISSFQVWVSVCTSSENGGGGISESEHFIWKFGSQCALHLKPGGYIWIWTIHLKIWAPERLGVVITVFSYYIRKTNEPKTTMTAKTIQTW